MIIRVGNSEPSAAATYHALRERRLCDLLGAWVSEIEPLIFERIDISPQVLAEVGLGIDGDAAPRVVAQVTVTDMIAAGALE